jgi:AcrR family transcriptional regulator
MRPRGRRPGGADTRAAIIEAARSEFAAQGYDATSLRAIARTAGVDPALVHHYFGGKPEVFAAVVDMRVDPAALIERVLAGPREEVGEALVRTFLMVWDSEEGRQRFLALVRSAMSHEEATRMLREFLTHVVFGRVTTALARDGADREELQLGAGLAAGQMVGMAIMRYVIRFPGVEHASHDELAAMLGPTVQRYLAPPEVPEQ